MIRRKVFSRVKDTTGKVKLFSVKDTEIIQKEFGKMDESDELDDRLKGYDRAALKSLATGVGVGALTYGAAKRLPETVAKVGKLAKKDLVKGFKSPKELKKITRKIKAGKGAEKILRVIEKNPKAALGITAGIGLAAGASKYKKATDRVDRDINRKYRGDSDKNK